MKRFIFLILLSSTTSGFAQETILVTKNRDKDYEEYSVLKSDKKIRQGDYIKLRKPLYGGFVLSESGRFDHGEKNGFWETYYKDNNNIKSRGYYKNNLKDSLWIFYFPEGIKRNLQEIQSGQGVRLEVLNAHPVISMTGNYLNGKLKGLWMYFDTGGNIVQKYDFDNDSLIFLGNGNIRNRASGFIGGDLLMNLYLNDTFDFEGLMKSIDSKINLHKGTIAFTFTIDENGRMIDIRETKNDLKNKKFYDRALLTVNSLSGMWYPKMMNGSKMKENKSISFNLDESIENQSRADDKWVYYKEVLGFNFRIIVN